MVAMPVAFQAVLAVLAMDLQKKVELLALKESQSKEIIYHSSEVYLTGTSLAVLTMATRFPNLPGVSTLSAELLQQKKDYMAQEYRELYRLLKDRPKGLEELRQLERAGAAAMTKSEALVSRKDGFLELGAVGLMMRAREFQQLQTAVYNFHTKTVSIREPELLVTREIEAQLKVAKQKLQSMSQITVVGTVLVAALMLLIFGGDIARRISVLVENAKRLPVQESLLPPLEGSDELCLLDRAFHNASEQLSMISEQRNRFYHMIAHDLRSPLTSVLLRMEMLEAEFEPGRTPSYLPNVSRSLEKVLGLINDLLDLEKLSAGKMPLERAVVPCREIFALVQDVCLPLAESKRVELVLPACDNTVYCDSERIAQVLINLIVNAVKFSECQRSVTVGCDHAPDGEASFFVADQGRGIPAELLQDVFLEFTQAKTSDATKGFGTGLGLAICKMIVEAHGGRIRVESESGVGSTFAFTIPQQKAEDSLRC